MVIQLLVDVSASDAVLGGERECGLAAVGDLAGDTVEVARVNVHSNGRATLR